MPLILPRSCLSCSPALYRAAGLAGLTQWTIGKNRPGPHQDWPGLARRNAMPFATLRRCLKTGPKQDCQDQILPKRTRTKRLVFAPWSWSKQDHYLAHTWVRRMPHASLLTRYKLSEVTTKFLSWSFLIRRRKVSRFTLPSGTIRDQATLLKVSRTAIVAGASSECVEGFVGGGGILNAKKKPHWRTHPG